MLECRDSIRFIVPGKNPVRSAETNRKYLSDEDELASSSISEASILSLKQGLSCNFPAAGRRNSLIITRLNSQGI